MLMPDGQPFPFWEDRTQYRRVLHVAAGHSAADDGNPGTEARPLKTISRAAELLQPGEKAVIHGGVYRECVRPACGGTGPEAMISYEAAPGEQVCVRGSEVWTDALAHFRPTDNAANQAKAPAGVTIWMGDLPAQLFVGYHPFLINNTSGVMMLYGHVWSPDEMKRYLSKRGLLLANGRQLEQVSDESDLTKGDGRFWVDVSLPALHFRLPGDADPHVVQLEITAREQIFAPRVRELAYVRVAGLTFEHCADPMVLTSLQHGAVSATAGHHWIVEDCTVRHCNSTAMDLGIQQQRLPAPVQRGGHIVRRCHISHCGSAGICGLGSPDGTLIEDCLFEHIGGLKIEKMFECAAVKFHVCHRILIRRNVFRHLVHACGIWLDYLCGWNRISGNVFTDIDSLFGGAHIESSFEPHWVDGNVFWDIRSWRAGEWGPESPMRGGHGIFVDSSDLVTVAHNFFGPSVSYAAAFHFKQADRIVAGRVGLNRRHQVLNNVFAGCAKRVLLGRADENRCDGNLYDSEGDKAALCIYRPEPAAMLTLAAWREYFGLDRRSTQTRITAAFDGETGALSWQADPASLAGVQLDGEHALTKEGLYTAPGPFSREAWAETLKTGRGQQTVLPRMKA